MVEEKQETLIIVRGKFIRVAATGVPSATFRQVVAGIEKRLNKCSVERFERAIADGGGLLGIPASVISDFELPSGFQFTVGIMEPSPTRVSDE